MFERISGLALKPKKFVVVPLGKPPTVEFHKSVRDFLLGHVPELASFAVQDSAEYLGMLLGSSGGNNASWAKPLKNFRNRSQDISRTGIAPSFGTDLYNQKAVPVTSYVSQLCEITLEVEKEELMALQRVFHLPHHAFPCDSYYYLLEGGFRKIIPLKVTAKAALIRTALKTCTVWKDELKQLNAVRGELSSMLHLVRFPSADFHPDNKRWKSAAFADNLASAVRFVKENKISITN